MAQFVANLVKNYAKTFLQSHLSRTRPTPPERNDLYLVPLTDKAEGSHNALHAAFLGEVRVCRPLPPRFDEELARLLRNLAVAWQLAAQRHSRSALVVLQGSTLHGWFHVGSQLPWKSDIHIAVVLLPGRKRLPFALRARAIRRTPGGTPSREAAEEQACGEAPSAGGAKEFSPSPEGAKPLRGSGLGVLPTDEAGDTSGEGGDEREDQREDQRDNEDKEVVVDRIRSLAERIFRDMEPILDTSEVFPARGSKSPTLAATVWGVRGERPDRKHIRIYSYLQFGNRLAEGVTLRRASIDGGNTSTHVPWPKAEIVRQLRQWHEQRCRTDAGARSEAVSRKRGGRKGGKAKFGGALRSIPTLLHNRLEEIRDKHGGDAAARLHMPSPWRYLPEKNAFHIPNRIEAALSWPPSFATVSTAIYVLLILFVLYVVCTSVMPSLAYSLDRKAATRARNRAMRESPSS